MPPTEGPEAVVTPADEVLRDYVGAFVDELARSGVRHVVIAPGSRSTPLAICLEQHQDIRIWMHLDERSAAFFALGMAKASRRPVGVLCTSGTAAANFLPAVVEARYGRVPLLVLTADRPPELQDVGAPQTIDQEHLYGGQVKWFASVALPETGDAAMRYARMLADRAAATARSSPAGPVHLNFPFREPLMPALPARAQTLGERRPQTVVHDTVMACPPHVAERLAAELGRMTRGLIVCGPQDSPDLAPAVTRLAGLLGYPILADPLSQVRCEPPGGEAPISTYDAFLRDASVAGSLAPEVVLRFGAIPTSKSLGQYLQRHPCRQILVDSAGWNDPIHTATDVVHAEPATFCQSLTDAVSVAPAPVGGVTRGWGDAWRRAGELTRAAMAEALAEIDELFEGKVFAELAEILPAEITLWLGSSMPVRDADTFFPSGTKGPTRFLSNRGANGIDGVISSALGASAAGRRSPGSGSPLVLVIGDLSFYHDMNGLLAAKLHALDATIVLLNNDGGGIFSFLPQAGTPAFETLFGTPHGLDFRPAVEMYGGEFERVTSWSAFRSAVRRGTTSGGLAVIEVPTERERNVVLHRQVWERVSQALGGRREVAV